MPIDIANTEAKLEVNFPSRVSSRKGRLFIGAKQPYELTVIQAVTKIVYAPDRSWFGALIWLKECEPLIGLDIEGDILDGSGGFNTFGIEHQIVGDDICARFHTAFTPGEGSEKVIAREPFDLTVDDLKFISTFVGFGAVQQAGKVFSFNQICVPWSNLTYTQS